MLIILLRLILCFFPFWIFAYNDLDVPSVASMEGLPSNLVNNCVCAITGEYIDNALDITIPGPEPLNLTRFYSSLSSRQSFGMGWFLNHRDKVHLGTTQKDYKSLFYVLINQASGAQLNYTCPTTSDVKKKLNFELTLPRGLVNGGSSQSGRYNLKNQQVHYQLSRDNEIIKVIDSSGSIRKFKRLQKLKDGNDLHQIEERKLNGHLITYLHDENFDLTDIVLKGPSERIYSSIKLKMNKDKSAYVFNTSDGKTATYHFQQKNGYLNGQKTALFYLDSVERSDAPKTTYEYHAGSDHQYLTRKSFRGQYQETEYYYKGSNILSGLPTVHIKEKDDARIHRVKALKAPVGHDNTPIITHQFIYHAKTKETKNGIEVLNGETEVYDAYLHKTTYAYNKEHRLRTVEKFAGVYPNFQLYSKDRYLWGSEDSPQEGNLLGKYISNGQGQILKAVYFEYDDRGNMTKERLCGRLTSLNAPELSLNSHHYPIANGYECDEKIFFYSGDGLNLLVREQDSSGKSISYSYQPGTDLLTSQLIADHDQIKMREFYEYDQDAVLVKKIIDDGCSNDKNNLTGVTERHLTKIYPRSAAPFGLPEQMDEMYIDKETGEEKLLKRIMYEYSLDGHLTKQNVYGSDGIFAYSQSWIYDAHGNVIKETDAMGQVIVKSYDKNDNLESIQGPHPDYKIKYQYDCSNRLIQQIESYGNQQFVSSFRYDYLGNKTVASNYYGQETLYEYDEFGRVVKTTYPFLSNEHGQLTRPTETQRYNELDQLVSATDAKGQTISTQYNIRGQPLCIHYLDDSKETFIYYLNGSLKQKIEKNGSYTIYERDYQDRIVKEKVYSKDHQLLKCSLFSYNAFHLTQSIGPDGLVTNYEYDGAGRLIATIKGEHRTTQTYDSLGRLIEIQEQQERIHKKTYDVLNRILEEKILDRDGSILHISQYSYDIQGNQTSVKSGDCGKTRTEYNPHRKPTKIIDALGHVTVITYNHDFVDGYGFRVLQTTTTDPLGYQIIETHDNIGRVVETIRKNPLGEKISYQQTLYDMCGNKSRQVDEVMQGIKSLRVNTTFWFYNSSNKLDTLIEAAWAPEQKITKYQYNASGQLAIKIKPDGKKLFYEYDDIGRLKTFKSSDGSIQYTYTYNLTDLPIEISDGKAVTIREYDIYGQMVAEQLGHQLIMKYTYDDLGHATRVTLPNDSFIEYKHHVLDLKEVHRWNKDVCQYSHLNLQHDRSGNTRLARLAGQTSNTQYSYDALGRCVKMSGPYLNESIPKKGYDAAGNLLSYSSGTTTHRFTYDDYYQIKTEQGHTEHQYSCDSLSNRTAKDDQVCISNSLNQLLQQGNEHYTYDMNGNLVQRIVGKEITSYTYDALDRLITVVTKEGRKIEYTYDAFNRRLSKKEKGEDDQLFLYQGMEEIGLWKNGEITELKVLGDGRKRRMVAIELNQKTCVPIQDLFGHPICLVDLQGNILEKYQYTAFGEEKIVDATGQSITSQNPWRYAGKRVDEETGFVAFGMRYYDPSLGRWVTADPIGYEDGPNLYAYLHHNPHTYFDALGLYGESLLWDTSMFIIKCFPPFHLLNYNDLTHYSFEDKIPKYNSIEDFEKSCSLLDAHETPPIWYTEFTSTYDLNHEKIRTVNSPQFIDDKDISISFTNGIKNAFGDFSSSLKYLGSFSKGFNVSGIHSPTFGLMRDLLNAMKAKKENFCFDEVRELNKKWLNFFANASPSAVALHYCHSRGAINTKKALMNMPEELRKRIHVVAIAPAEFIDQELCGSVTHYVSKADCIPYSDPTGMKRCQETIVFLNPLPGAPIGDHSFNSPTYEEPINFHMRKYLRNKI